MTPTTRPSAQGEKEPGTTEVADEVTDDAFYHERRNCAACMSVAFHSRRAGRGGAACVVQFQGMTHTRKTSTSKKQQVTSVDTETGVMIPVPGDFK